MKALCTFMVVTSYPCMGEVMVYLRGLWGAVCADNFTDAAADSVCRQLGYTNSNGQSKRGYVVMKSELLVTACEVVH